MIYNYPKSFLTHNGRELTCNVYNQSLSVIHYNYVLVDKAGFISTFNFQEGAYDMLPLMIQLETAGIQGATRVIFSSGRMSAILRFNRNAGGNSFYDIFYVDDNNQERIMASVAFDYPAVDNYLKYFFFFTTGDNCVSYMPTTVGYYKDGGYGDERYCRPESWNTSSWVVNATDFVNNTKHDIEDPYGTVPENENPGAGYGPYDYTSETETPPQLPTLSAAQVGFVSLWNPTQAEMQGLANYLWTGTFDLTNFKKLFTDPMECVLSVGIIPITPTREASKREIVFGGSSHSGVNAYAVTEQFYVVDMGTLHITGMSQGALDYSPYAKASIYLPYCGTYALDVDEIMDSDISLEYHIDIYTGACVAYLTIDGHVNSDGKNVNAIMYQFTGNVLASIPITGNDHSQFIQSMLFMGAAAAATVATSGAGAGAAAGAGADLGAETAATGFNKALAGSAVNTVMSMKPNVLHSGNLSTTAGMLGGQKPFITMTWSNLCRPEDEYKLVGLPLHKSGTLSDFSGFTIVSACHMDNILCTEAELQMIEQALAKGVII